jgi:hypothetical protein
MKRSSSVRLHNESVTQSWPMTKIRTLAIVIGLALFTHVLQSQDRPRYREFQLGSDLASVAAQGKVDVSDAKTLHLRPAVLQELEWRPSYFTTGSTVQNDPVQRIVLSFYNDQLSRVAVDYHQDRTEGMTDADMIDGISVMYGLPLKPAAIKTRKAPSPSDEGTKTAIASWGDAEYSVVLYRTTDPYRSTYASRFQMIVTSPQLDALARTAGAEAARLDAQDAPQREIARQKKDVVDARASAEKARLANKAAFRP